MKNDSSTSHKEKGKTLVNSWLTLICNRILCFPNQNLTSRLEMENIHTLGQNFCWKKKHPKKF